MVTLVSSHDSLIVILAILLGKIMSELQSRVRFDLEQSLNTPSGKQRKRGTHLRILTNER